MPDFKKLTLATISFFFYYLSLAQDNTLPAKDEGVMRSEGKIYVVMAIVITILAGLIIYVARLDKKISRLEKGE